MVLTAFVMFIVSIIVLIKSSGLAIRYASSLARSFRLSEFIISFFIIAVISVLPESTIAIISALKGIPEFGVSTILGSNVADLSLVLGLVAFASKKGISVKSEIIKKDVLFFAILAFPILLGLDGSFSRIDGAILITGGIFFFYRILNDSRLKHVASGKLHPQKRFLDIVLLLLTLTVLIISANYTITFGQSFAEEIGVPAILVALIFVAVGTCLPELAFSLKAVRSGHNDLAMGDLLGTVINDATIVIGITALISPITLPPRLILITGMFMLIAGALVMFFIDTGHRLTKKEGAYLLMFYGIFLLTEVILTL